MSLSQLLAGSPGDGGSPGAKKRPGSIASLGSGQPIVLNLGDDAAKLAKRLRTQAGSASSKVDALGMPDERGPQSVCSQHYTPDGRECNGCTKKDNSRDPADGLFLAWWYLPKHGKNSGLWCWHCGKAWHTKFRHDKKTDSLSKLKLELGRDDVLLADFKNVMQFVVDKAVAGGSRDMRIQATEVASVVVSKVRKGVEVSSFDNWVELEYYKTQWEGGQGDPLTNSKGHRLARSEGILGVMVPGPPVKKIKKVDAQYVDVDMTEDDGSVQPTADHQSKIMSCIAAGFMAQFGMTPATRSGAGSVASSSGGSSTTFAPAPRAQALAVASPDGKRKPVSDDGGDDIANTAGFQFVIPQLPGAEVSPPGGQAKAGAKAGAHAAAAGGRPRSQPGGDGSSASGAGAAQAKAAAGRGRKKRNLIAESTRVAREFSICEPSDKTHFGTGAKTMLAWMLRLSKDFEGRLLELDEEEDSWTPILLFIMMSMPVACR